jgi:DNA (cytosine-5)-methyltransferase 1
LVRARRGGAGDDAGVTATVIDLFSGAGGASAGFAAHPRFRLVGAADAQLGKPSSRAGSLACNATYAANLGIAPTAADLGSVDPDDLGAAMGLTGNPTVLIACPPCTGFSRTLADNHLRDDPRNSLVRRTARFVAAFAPEVLVLENARELVMGRHRGHLAALTTDLRKQGYAVRASTHLLNRFGLPQKRERALVIAVRDAGSAPGLDELWQGLEVDPKATHVRRAIWHLPALANGGVDPDDPAHACSMTRDGTALRRIAAIPHDGGSWFDLAHHPDADHLLTPTMRDRLARGALGSHPDVYGRMHWDRPAPTVKRECSHVGNGRYTHPEQDRLCSVRELAILNGFPADYRFCGGLNNGYRHVGDAVPPLISHQLAWLVDWLLTGRRPGPEQWVLPNTSLQVDDIRPAG